MINNLTLIEIEAKQVIDNLNKLLSVLDFKVMPLINNDILGPLNIIDKKSKSVIECTTYPNLDSSEIYEVYRRLTFSNYKTLANELGIICYFNNPHPVDSEYNRENMNPYYGCKNLEEMMIKRDLTASGL